MGTDAEALSSLLGNYLASRSLELYTLHVKFEAEYCSTDQNFEALCQEVVWMNLGVPNPSPKGIINQQLMFRDTDNVYKAITPLANEILVNRYIPGIPDHTKK
jgi:hypothetical protein